MTDGVSAGARPCAEVVVVGCGAIGLPLAIALSRAGHRVLGCDIDSAKVADLNRGRQTLLDEGLGEALTAALGSSALSFATVIEPSDLARAFVIATPTPASADSGFDDAPLMAAMAAVARVARDGDLVCLRSTAPIGTTRALAAAHPRLAFAACPDRTLSGRALAELSEAPHLVGGVTPAAATAAEGLFACLGKVTRVRDAETAEAIKLFANVQRDLAFATANQFALICEAAGLDFGEVRIAGAEGYPRFQLARAGPVGGPCLTKDLHVLAASEAVRGLNLDLLMAGRRLNNSVADHLAGQILQRLEAAPGPVAILGLVFKGWPATRDRRGAFAGALEGTLRRARPGLDIRTWDPQDREELASSVTGASVIVLANDDPALARAMDEINRLAPGAVVFDTAGVLGDPPAARRLGNGRRA